MFKVGDRVRNKYSGALGTVDGIHPSADLYSVKYDDFLFILSPRDYIYGPNDLEPACPLVGRGAPPALGAPYSLPSPTAQQTPAPRADTPALVGINPAALAIVRRHLKGHA